MTTLYDPGINSDPLASGFLAYGQIPTPPVYPFPLPPATTDVFTPIPNLLTTAPRNANGVTLNTPSGFAHYILFGRIENRPTALAV